MALDVNKMDRDKGDNKNQWIEENKNKFVVPEYTKESKIKKV